jgi:hypothetical protein
MRSLTITEFQPAQTLAGFAGEACTLRERTAVAALRHAERGEV